LHVPRSAFPCFSLAALRRLPISSLLKRLRTNISQLGANAFVCKTIPLLFGLVFEVNNICLFLTAQ
jgi:hypothetical protein